MPSMQTRKDGLLPLLQQVLCSDVYRYVELPTCIGSTPDMEQCSWLNSRLGRKKTLLAYTLIYAAGILGQTFSNGSLAGLYVARVISGFGIGGTTVVPSIYLSEVSYSSVIYQQHTNMYRLHQSPSEA